MKFLYIQSATNTSGINTCPVISTDLTDQKFNDELEILDQEFKSNETSINSSRVPAIFKLVKHWSPGSVNLDYGGGKFDTATDYLKNIGVTNYIFDPYNRSSKHNNEVLSTLRSLGGADTATCSNVLNVIKEESVRKNVIENIYRLLNNRGVAYFTVYEGDGSGNDRESTKGYQLHRKTEGYLEEILKVFPNAYQRSKKLIVAPKSSNNVNSSVDIYYNLSTTDEEDIAEDIIDDLNDKLDLLIYEDIQGDELRSSYVEYEVNDNLIIFTFVCECDYEYFSYVCEQLNDVISTYEENSYFDIDVPGRATCYIYL